MNLVSVKFLRHYQEAFWDADEACSGKTHWTAMSTHLRCLYSLVANMWELVRNHLSKIFKGTTGSTGKGCSRREQAARRGWIWGWKKRKEIVDWRLLGQDALVILCSNGSFMFIRQSRSRSLQMTVGASFITFLDVLSKHMVACRQTHCCVYYKVLCWFVLYLELQKIWMYDTERVSDTVPHAVFKCVPLSRLWLPTRLLRLSCQWLGHVSDMFGWRHVWYCIQDWTVSEPNKKP